MLDFASINGKFAKNAQALESVREGIKQYNRNVSDSVVLLRKLDSSVLSDDALLTVPAMRRAINRVRRSGGDVVLKGDVFETVAGTVDASSIAEGLEVSKK